jgi:hypothetical protein
MFAMRKIIVSVCALGATVGVAACGGDAAARPSSWKPFCAQLAEMKKASETPGGWNKGPSDPQGTKAYDADYIRVERISPSSAVADLLAEARPLFNGVVAFTKPVEDAVPAARRLRPIVARECDLELGDVFKVRF